MWADAWGAFAGAAVGECGGVEIVDLFPRAGSEGHHGSVGGSRLLLIEWFADRECELAGAVLFVDPPARGDAVPLGVADDAALHAKRRLGRIVESSGALEIIGAEVDVGEHGANKRRSLTVGVLATG